MKNRFISFGIGFAISLLFAGLTWGYLTHQKNKKGFVSQSPYVDIIETLDLRFNDIKYKFLKKRETPENIVMVAVDDASIREIGRWPWGRDLFSQMTETLLGFGVKVIGMDVIFGEPEKAFPENDARLSSVFAAHADKIVLGTYSDDMIKIQPFQDYCVNEAFLQSGGGDLSKTNHSFVVDDVSDEFVDLRWSPVFRAIFGVLRKQTENEFLAEHNKKNVAELSVFQRNYLESLKTKATFSYCATWLTEADHVFSQNLEALSDLYKKTFDAKESFSQLPYDRQIAKFKNEVADFPMPQYGQWQSNIEKIQKSSKYTGSFVAYLDLDGSVRRYPLFYRSGNRIGTSFVPSLALQTYLLATGHRADVTIEAGGQQKKITSFKIMDPQQDPETVVQDVPVDSQGRILVNYYGPQHTLQYVSAKDLFSDDKHITVYIRERENEFGQILLHQQKQDKAEFFKDKSVILGVTSIGVYDLRSTPVAANFPGPEIHLTVLGNLFQKQYLRRLAHESVQLPVLMLVLGVTLTLLIAFWGALSTVISLFVTVIAVVFVDKYVYDRYGVITSSSFVIIEVMSLHFALLIFKYFSEERKRSELKKTFSKYVSPAVVDELLKNEENLKLGGRKQEMSVFFSDVRGFTEFSEKMDPQDLSQFLNEYLTPMTDIIFKNKGTLDKYMGDGVMAFFGAPVPFTDHAHHACVCALESLEKLKKIQTDFAKRQWPQIDIGIGVNTGFMSVGNMGSKIVQSYTVIGDAVNLGARLEGATKEYGVRILVSETTYAEVSDDFILREVDRVRVKGKKEPIRAYELMGFKTDTGLQDLAAHFDKGYRLYHEHRFAEAKDVFSQIEAMYPADKLSKIYKQRCEQFIANPPPPEWDGVFEMKTK